MLTKEEILLGKGSGKVSRPKSSRVRQPRRTALGSLWFYGNGLSFRVVFSQSF